MVKLSLVYFFSENDSRMGKWISFNHTVALQMYMVFLGSCNGVKMCQEVGQFSYFTTGDLFDEGPDS